MKSYESHHIIHERAWWDSQPPQRQLRAARGMIIPLPVDYHRPVLHANVPAIPLITSHIAARALKLYYPSPEAGMAVDSMCMAINEASLHPRVHRVERDMAQLAIHALEIQRPYLVAAQLFPSNERAA